MESTDNGKQFQTNVYFCRDFNAMCYEKYSKNWQ